ncbi:MAG TPA: RNA polymerase sigma factor [Candidatus Eremiobacteraceae bacterium]|nr:RNA polymerase sigma factor [Candidatus Eremiobacteraceae bacterium]
MRSSSPIPVAIAEGGPSVVESTPLHRRIDEAAFQLFYAETTPKLWAYIRRASGDGALADDLLQETFCRFLRADLPALEKMQMKAYLYRIASSLLADHWREVKRQRRWSFDFLSSTRTVEDAAQGGDTMHLFERLKAQEQTLLWLAYVEGLDHREIALALRLREKSVRVLLFRARKKLASILTNQGINPEGEL